MKEVFKLLKKAKDRFLNLKFGIQIKEDNIFKTILFMNLNVKIYLKDLANFMNYNFFSNHKMVPAAGLEPARAIKPHGF